MHPKDSNVKRMGSEVNKQSVRAEQLWTCQTEVQPAAHVQAECMDLREGWRAGWTRAVYLGRAFQGRGIKEPTHIP